MKILDKLKELRDKATPAPWGHNPLDIYGVFNLEPLTSRDYLVKASTEQMSTDAKLIATMRNSLDLWLELARDVQRLLDVKHDHYCMDCGVCYLCDLDRTYGKILGKDRYTLAKLRGESE